MSRDWTKDEVEKVVDWYFQHLDLQEKRIKKLPKNFSADPPALENRRRASITQECHHISQVLQERDSHWLRPYGPMRPKYVQTGLRSYVLQMAIAKHYIPVRGIEAPTANPDELDRRVDLLLARAKDPLPEPEATTDPA